MRPIDESLLEAVRDNPGAIDPIIASDAARRALDHIKRLESALLGIKRGAPEGSHARLTAEAALTE